MHQYAHVHVHIYMCMHVLMYVCACVVRIGYVGYFVQQQQKMKRYSRTEIHPLSVRDTEIVVPVVVPDCWVICPHDPQVSTCKLSFFFVSSSLFKSLTLVNYLRINRKRQYLQFLTLGKLLIKHSHHRYH